MLQCKTGYGINCFVDEMPNWLWNKWLCWWNAKLAMKYMALLMKCQTGYEIHGFVDGMPSWLWDWQQDLRTLFFHTKACQWKKVGCHLLGLHLALSWWVFLDLVALLAFMVLVTFMAFMVLEPVFCMVFMAFMALLASGSSGCSGTLGTVWPLASSLDLIWQPWSK